MREQDLRAALDFLERIGGARDLDEFAETLVTGLGEAIPCDIATYNEVNPSLGRASFVNDVGAEEQLPDASAILARHMRDNPLVVYAEATRDGSARTWSDFTTRRRLQTTELWNGLFRPFAIEHQMAALLPTVPPLLVGVVLNRRGPDFSERDRTLLNLLRPHLVNAYRNAQARTVHTALEGAAADRGEAVVVLGSLGEPLSLGVRARALVAAFGEAPFDQLPTRLVDWIRRARDRSPLPAEPLVGTGDRGDVEASLLSPSVVVLRLVRGRIDSASLYRLGLSRRESEVLALVAEGRTNKEIAVEIGVRPATVTKHLERIFMKLGVHTRTAAAAAAFRASESPGGGAAA